MKESYTRRKYRIRGLNVQCAIMKMVGVLPMEGCSEVLNKWIATSVTAFLCLNVITRLIFVRKFNSEISFWRSVTNISQWYYQTFTFFMYLSLCIDAKGALTLKRRIERTFRQYSSEETRKIVMSSRKKEETFCLVAMLTMMNMVATALFAFLVIMPRSLSLKQSMMEYYRREGKR